MRPLIDGHLDLAWNGASHDRELTLELAELNAAEEGMTDVGYRGKATVTFPEMRRGGIYLCLATFLARSGPKLQRKPSYLRTDVDYNTRIGSYAAAHAQWACYEYWQEIGEIRVLRSGAELEDHLRNQAAGAGQRQPIGVILSMEGADPITRPEQLDHWYNLGLRAIGPAHYGFSHYAGGTAVDGPLTSEGKELLKRMELLNMAMDVTHLCDRSMAEALDLFGGTVWASHHNCRALVPADRQLTDEQIKQLIARDAVIAAAADAWMLRPNWIIGKTLPGDLKITSIADHIDRVCQFAGNAKHSAIGSDLDGGFGTEQTPSDLKSIADLQQLDAILQSRGYSSDDIEDIFHRNWLRMFRRVLR